MERYTKSLRVISRSWAETIHTIVPTVASNAMWWKRARARIGSPDYYAPRILYWLEKHSFYPLRIEQYGRDGKLAFIEVRMTTMFNPAMGERGYGPLLITYWDIASDTLTYSVRDNHRLKRGPLKSSNSFSTPISCGGSGIST